MMPGAASLLEKSHNQATVPRKPALKGLPEGGKFVHNQVPLGENLLYRRSTLEE